MSALGHRPVRLLALALVVGLALTSDGARAWESECRAEAASYGGVATGHSMSICRAVAAPMCAPGIGFARGAQLGEHGYIAREGLRAAGLSSFADGSFELSFYASSHTVSPGDPASPGATVPSEAPARIGRMSRLVRRTTSIASFAQVPDGSHSLGDFLFGNEHCPVAGLPRDGGVANRACHTFSLHMGLINSSHFLPQAQDVYFRYHLAARVAAMRCAQLETDLAGVTHPYVVAERDAILASCEREALALEAFGSHFLADAWSTGHMWERWGSPAVPATAERRYDAGVVSIVSGMIHGWRSVVRGFVDVDLQHDRLCLAGPGDDDPEDAVRWGRAAMIPAVGGGDLYLMPCLAYGGVADDAVSARPYLRQYNRMRACLGRGFGEVYDLGPRTAGDRVGREASYDADVTGVGSDLCWDQRVTNASLRGGFDGFLDLTDPGLVTRLAAIVGTEMTGVGGTVPAAAVLRTNDRMRLDLAGMGVVLTRRAERDPGGLDLATLADGRLRRLLGYERNSERRAEIGTLPFLDDEDVVAWSDVPLAGCRTDADCGSGEVCDPTAVAAAGGPACVRQEAAIVRAFRAGEIVRACERETEAELLAAREHCRTVGGEACDACVAVLLPHLRNACDSAAWASASAAGRTELESPCDALYRASALTGAPVGVYQPHRVYADPAMARAEARAAAMTLCTTPPPPPPPAPTSWCSASGDPPAGGTLSETATGFANSGWCGPVSAAFWWRGTHAPTGTTHTHSYRLVTATFDDLPTRASVGLFALERLASCDAAAPVLDTARTFDADGDSVPDALVLDWTPSAGASEELCLRVRALDPTLPTVTGLQFLF